MKVGLAVTNLVASQGGAYTFVVEMLKAIERARSTISHELVLCCHGGTPDFANHFSGYVLDLDAQRATILSFRERFLELLPSILGRLVRRAFPARTPMPSWDERLLRREGIEFIVRLVPWCPVTMDIPYALIHWDLQHRINPWFPEVSSRGQWNAREAGASQTLRRASLIYVASREGLEQIVHYYQVPSERIRILAFPSPTFTCAPVSTQAAPKVAGDYLFYPAQFWPHKNHVVMLEACKDLRQRENWDLRIVFTGSDKGNERYVRAYARKLDLEAYVSFLGLVEQAELAILYSNAFCLVFPSFCGPENLPPMEAFALGCPVVASDIPGAREQMGEAAFFFNPIDAKALANCLLKLRDLGVRQEMVEAGRKLANATSWDDYASGLAASLDDFSLVRRTWS